MSIIKQPEACNGYYEAFQMERYGNILPQFRHLNEAPEEVGEPHENQTESIIVHEPDQHYV